MIICIVVFTAALIARFSGRNLFSTMIKQMLLILMAMAGIGMAAGSMEQGEKPLQEELQLEREENGAGEYEVDLKVDAGTLLHDYEYQIKVPEQTLTAKEQEAYLKAAVEEMEKAFPGKNEDVNCIREGVVIRESYQEGRVTAEWDFDINVIDTDGTVIETEIPEEGVFVQANVTLTCGEAACDTSFAFRVMPKLLSEQERFLNKLGSYIEQQKEQTTTYLKLPERLEGQTLVWKVKEEHLPEKIMLLGILLALGIPLAEGSRKQEAQKKREAQLLLEYPDMVSKLSLLMGAGMTVSGAWNKIAAEYINKRKNNTIQKRFVYEEMLFTCHEMESGMGEERAYERFGERCGLRSYRKLGNLLAQNLRKGSNGLLLLMEAEVCEAFEERKSTARKYGEEAGTKLLLPMILMLGMIMVLLLVPAMMSFQI